MRIRDLQTAVANTLGSDSRLTGVQVSVHGGDFDLSELEEYAKRAPAAVLATTQAMGEYQGGQPRAHCTFILIVLCEDKPANPRGVQILDYSDAVMRVLLKTGQHWGLQDGLGAVTKVAARNLYSRKLDAKGIAMWGVAWMQAIDLTDGTDLGVPLELIHADWDLSPRANGAPLIPAEGSVKDLESEVDLT